ncbi:MULTISPECIES: UDP-N-acetylmuramoyl-L-alanine--D-glutamate ligase [unclassified Spirosoma]|uniref:UDP-N-acetylmuramoyl-L-alanine--D-glutamate ligase n=1 Tax=unclassified Spirosoma TaxID=2621999 RepID=UPI00095C804B|nr:MULTISPECIES: UDP-N-acetylmuramoyl-L-alanine--D-glutamate ligase [unclassified Spirosoma]MBN8824716.1 UDP-N-acetylmuramoyl-L-alanine--D-glutamate ligase [Spirosoma sp.]OJW78741.1 MAG: UDP-N-acetylmuramoylalanine--D-glutamate ligase [Spirosoma sp. 48-14]
MSVQKIVILGGGESGVGAALLAQAKGFGVFLSDKGTLKESYRTTLQTAQIPFEEGKHTEELILDATEVIKSPGIPETAPLVQKLRAQGTPVISEIEFAARYTRAKLIGITGSNGKTTTTLLTYHLLKTAGFNVGLAGNIGDSFAEQVITDRFDYFVLELSSFQLDDMYNTHLDVMVLLNITPDHLDRYGYNFQNYVDSKFRILQNARPDDDFIFFAESQPILAEFEKRHPEVNRLPVSLLTAVSPGGYLENGQLITANKNRSFAIAQADTPLRGPHNAINMLSAMLAAQSVGVSNEALAQGLKTFQNAAHRLEPAGTIHGIQFINDSKATNVDSVFYALSSMDAPTVWIAGGLDKGNDYSQLDELVKQHVKALICLGIDNHKLVDYFGSKIPTIYETQSVADAVAKGLELAQPGEIVLLSPACASFDLFKNYEDRGNQFKAAVQKLL